MLDFLFGNLIGADRDVRDIINNISEIAPFIIFAVIWLFAAIAKTLKSSQKDQKGGQTSRKANSQPDFNDFVRIIRERYAEARRQAQQKSSAPRPSPPQKPSFSEHPVPAPVPVNKPHITPVYEVTVPSVPQQPLEDKPENTKPPQPELKLERPAEPFVVSDAIEVKYNPYIDMLNEQLAHPDGLRKAILYSEILGKPVGLRDN